MAPADGWDHFQLQLNAPSKTRRHESLQDTQHRMARQSTGSCDSATVCFLLLSLISPQQNCFYGAVDETVIVSPSIGGNVLLKSLIDTQYHSMGSWISLYIGWAGKSGRENRSAISQDKNWGTGGEWLTCVEQNPMCVTSHLSTERESVNNTRSSRVSQVSVQAAHGKKSKFPHVNYSLKG